MSLNQTGHGRLLSETLLSENLAGQDCVLLRMLLPAFEFAGDAPGPSSYRKKFSWYQVGRGEMTRKQLQLLTTSSLKRLAKGKSVAHTRNSYYPLYTCNYPAWLAAKHRNANVLNFQHSNELRVATHNHFLSHLHHLPQPCSGLLEYNTSLLRSPKRFTCEGVPLKWLPQALSSATSRFQTTPPAQSAKGSVVGNSFM